MKNSLRFVFCSLLVISACSDEPGNGSSNIELLGQLPLSGAITDVWGFTDNSGNEYAVVGFGLFEPGDNSGIYIVDVTDPANPVLVSTLNSVPGFDVKVWENYVYTVNGGGNGDGGIVDISNPAMPQKVGTFPSSHNIFISDGYMFLESPGVRIYNLNASRTNPPLVWSGGNEGHDATVVGNRLYDFHGFSGTNIYDITDPVNPQLLASWDAPFVTYNHSGWPSADGRFVFLCDELAQDPQADITVWNIEDLNNPEKVGEFGDPNATVHNLLIKGTLAFTAYYAAGFRVFDVSDPENIQLLNEFDTSTFAAEGFSRGAFGVYPFAPSGNIYVSDQTEGLFIFSFDNQTPATTILAP